MRHRGRRGFLSFSMENCEHRLHALSSLHVHASRRSNPPCIPHVQLHDTFDWAERSRKGLLLFIDEADAFLGECALAGLPFLGAARTVV